MTKEFSSSLVDGGLPFKLPKVVSNWSPHREGSVMINVDVAVKNVACAIVLLLGTAKGKPC